MTERTLASYFKLNEMPPGRHGFAMTGVRKVAVKKVEVKKSLTDLMPLIDECQECARKAQRLAHQWETTKKKRSSARGNAAEAKRAVESVLTSIFKITDGRATGTDEDDEIAKLAVELEEDVFPNGVRGISGKPFEEMLKTVDMLIKDHFEDSKVKHVEELHLTREVARLKKRNERLRAELHASPGASLEYEDVEKALDETHEATVRVMNAVCYHFPYNDEHSMREREELLAPINAQQADVAKARAQQQAPKDVDVDTGDELDEDDTDPADPLLGV